MCPLYAELGSEPSVARGKVRLARELIDGNLTVSPRLKEIMELCLNCKACVANCPPLVQTDKMVLATRAFIAEKEGLLLPVKAALRSFLPNNNLQGIDCLCLQCGWQALSETIFIAARNKAAQDRTKQYR